MKIGAVPNDMGYVISVETGDHGRLSVGIVIDEDVYFDLLTPGQARELASYLVAAADECARQLAEGCVVGNGHGTAIDCDWKHKEIQR